MFSSVRKFIRWIHLLIGFTSGLIVFIVAVTGVLWTFESEISNACYSYRTVEVKKNKQVISIRKIKQIVSPHLKKITSISYYGPDRSIEIREWKRANGKRINNYVYINPYSGNILAIKKNEPTFFDSVLDLHTNLMLGEFGSQLVRYATLCFFILIVSGIYLWWPRNKNGTRQRLKFDWKKTTKWRRKNYDVHSILGFYSSWIIIFVVITGLAWTFDWVDKTVYGVATLGQEYIDYPEVNSNSNIQLLPPTDLHDRVLSSSFKKYSGKMESWYYYFPQNKQESISLYLNPDRETWCKATAYYFDQRSGKLLFTESPASMNNGQFIRNMYYDIHIGKVLGLPGQLLVFFASLIVASLPITGFYIWFGRTFKNKKQTQ